MHFLKNIHRKQRNDFTRWRRHRWKCSAASGSARQCAPAREHGRAGGGAGGKRARLHVRASGWNNRRTGGSSWRGDGGLGGGGFARRADCGKLCEAHRNRSLLRSALGQARGVQVKAADLLGFSYRSFRHLMKKYDLSTSHRTRRSLVSKSHRGITHTILSPARGDYP